MISTRTTRGAALAVAALLALPAAALAQGTAGHHTGAMTTGRAAMGGGMMGGTMGGGMMSLGPTPAYILAQQDALGLTETQTARLDSLQGQVAEARQTHHAKMQDIHQQVSKLRQEEMPDLDRYQQLMREMASTGTAMHVRIATLGQEALGVLTPEQRSKVRYAMKLMGPYGMTGMMGRGTMGGGKGMGMMGAGSMMGPGSTGSGMPCETGSTGLNH